MAATTRVYQLFYDSSQIPSLDESFTPYDGRANPFPHYYEIYWILQLYESGLYKETDYCGLVSHKFSQKTGISGSAFLRFMETNPGHDVYFINPFPLNAYFFYNVWDQGDTNHPGVTAMAQKLLDASQYRISLSDLGRNDHRTLLFCNYWVGNRRFWDSYAPFLAHLFECAVGTERRKTDNGFFTPTVYKTDSAPFFPFVFERFFSTFLLLNPDVRACHYPHTKEEIFGTCAGIERIVVEAIMPLMDRLDENAFRNGQSLQKELFVGCTRLQKTVFGSTWYSVELAWQKLLRSLADYYPLLRRFVDYIKEHALGKRLHSIILRRR